MNVEELQKKDVPYILEIWKRAGDVFGIPYKQEINELIEGKRFLCIRENGKIVAMSGYKVMKKQPEVRIVHLWVAKTYRRKGLAVALIKELMERGGNLALTACCKEGAENNKFYDRFAINYETETKKTMNVRKYYLDKEKIWQTNKT